MKDMAIILQHKDFIEKRRNRVIEWKKIHPEGITKENYKEFKKFMANL